MDKKRIVAQPGFILSEADALDFARLFAKIGYCSQQKKVRPEDKPKAAQVRCIYFWEEEK